MLELRNKNYKVSDDLDKSLQIALRDISERLSLIEKAIQELQNATHTH